MVFFTDDLWATILFILPLKTITASKLVCKQWKSIVESLLFRELFLTRHQNSNYSLWSLICKNKNKNNTIEVLADYGCEIWGLQRPLNSYINSFIANKFLNHRKIYKSAQVVAYTDVGLVLIQVVSIFSNVYYYVANPVSRECVETDHSLFMLTQDMCPLGIATRIDENGVLSAFKVVLLYDAMPWIGSKSFSLLIYSSETGLWSYKTVHFPFAVSAYSYNNFISSNGNLHWLARNSNFDEVVVSIDFYSSTSSDRCRVTSFPDLGKVPKFERVCTTCQGFLTYMNVTKDNESVKETLSVWSLRSGEWELVSRITRENGFYDIPLALNPFDAKSAYFWSRYDKRLLLLNLLNGKFMRHNKSESSSGRISSSIEGAEVMKYIIEGSLASFSLPKWLHRIPNMVKIN